MRKPLSTGTILLAAAVVGMLASQYSMAEVLEKSKNIDGTAVQYRVVLPNP